MNNSNSDGGVYLIDNKMFGFDKWCSTFLIAGSKIALIDTGTPKSADIVRTGIMEHGFDLRDISYIFITHIHFDHCGCAGILMKEMPNCKIMVHPRIAKHLIDPSIVNANTKTQAGAEMAARFGEMVGIPSSQVHELIDGETFDLGNGHNLRVILAPGHHSSHLVVYDENDGSLFAGDAPGLYFGDEDVLMMPSPVGCNLDQAIETLKKLRAMSPTRLFLGHYGICKTAKEVMQRGLDALQKRIEVGSRAMEQEKQGELASIIISSMESEISKLKQSRGDSLYDYITGELVPMWTRGFIGYYEKSRSGN